jgi:hypothetical protein
LKNDIPFYSIHFAGGMPKTFGWLMQLFWGGNRLKNKKHIKNYLEDDIMKPNFTIIASSVMLASALMLTACSSSNESIASIAPSLTPTATVSPIASLAPSPTATASPIVATPVASVPAVTSPAVDDNSKLIKELMTLAKQGKVPDVKYGAHTGMMDDVVKAWGDADKQEVAGKGLYATYNKKNVVFGFNKGEQIFDVRSSDPSLQSLTLKEIEHTLAKPANITVNGDDTIYIYKANAQYQLSL